MTRLHTISKNLGSSQHSRGQKGDMQQVPYSEPANIWSHSIIFFFSLGRPGARDLCTSASELTKTYAASPTLSGRRRGSDTGLCFHKTKKTAGRNSNTRLQRLRHRGHQYRR